MKSLEFSKQIVSKTVRKSWDVAAAPTRISLHTINAFLGLLVENSDYEDQRKLIAERLVALHKLLKQSNNKIEYRLAGETEVYTIKFNDGRKIILYFRKQLIGYKASVEQQVLKSYQIEEEQEVRDYQKLESILYGPLFLAERLGTIRPFQHTDGISPSHELSQGQMEKLVELLQDVFNELDRK